MCSPTLARKEIQKKGRMCRMTGLELCSFPAIQPILPLFLGCFILPRSFLLLRIRLQETGVSTDWTDIARVHVSKQTLEIEYASTYSFLGPVHRLQTDGTIVWRFKNSVGPLFLKGKHYF
ncbi:hypothetical protein NPIL_304331 [Nephila pilipes]|uniref:Uncharacterized protein n=1 Tax=Nephila pilipes TaxID=299642 RepID=A0A8X6UER7_NEPPI|nr:hypothetical protein NPIL_304331 [Nephila pilipes]